MKPLILQSSLDSNAFIYIGGYPGELSLRGQIDEFMIFNRALSLSEIMSLYEY
jgi:hypothetical protein